MTTADRRVVHAIHRLSVDDHSAMEALLLEDAIGMGALERLPRPSGPGHGSWDGNEAWADRVLRHIFNLAGAGQWYHADAIASSALQVFGDLDDADQIARLTAVVGYAALGAGDRQRAFEYTTLALVQRTSGNLGRRSLASTANTIGFTFRTLRAWPEAIREFDAAYVALDLGTDAERTRAYLSLQQIVICLHEWNAADASGPMGGHSCGGAASAPTPGAVSPISRLRQIADVVAAASMPTGTSWPANTLAFIAAYVDAATRLGEGDPQRALRSAAAIRQLAPSLIGSEVLAWRLLGSRAAVAAGDAPAAVRWAAEAERVASTYDPGWLPDILQLRGQAAEASGDEAAALRDYRRAASLLTTHRSEHFHLLAGLLGSQAEAERSEQNLRDQSAELAREAGIDPLTGVANRRALAQLEQASDPDVAAVIVADIDHFKQINDNFGHVIGDEVLRRVARLLADAGGPDATVVRLGGDEFVVALHGGEDPVAGSHRALERVRGWPWHRLAPGMRVTISVGLATDGPFSRLLATADHALYESKRTGRDRVTALQVSPGG